MRLSAFVFVAFASCALVHAGDQRLILQLSSGIISERANAAYLLGMSDDPGVSELLLNQLQEEPVRENKLVIIESLKKLDTREGYRGLSVFYSNEQDIIIQRKIIQALGASGDRQYISLIAKSLELPEVRDQQLALDALRRIDHPDSVKAILSYYSTRRIHSEKERVLAALASQKRSEAVRPLILYGQRTNDPTERVRIAETLADIGDAQSQDFIYKWFKESDNHTSKKRYLASLKTLAGSKMIGSLSQELNPNDLTLQIEIVDAMVSIDKQAATPYLRAYYEKSMKNLHPEISRLEAAKTIRLHKFLREQLAIEGSANEMYPEEWKNDPVIGMMIAG